MTSPTAPTATLTRERADLLDALTEHRHLLRRTLDGLSEAQVRLRPTVSQLSLAGLVKHLAHTEERWQAFIVEGPSAMAMTEERYAAHAESFEPTPEETIDVLLARFDATAARTEELIRTLPDLDAAQPLPPAPWFDEDVQWSARRVLVHILAELTQHAGHADILREAIDGQKTMG